jgi:precorrin-2 dehydrogenase/sirohydrochlorin ferrochelatase
MRLYPLFLKLKGAPCLVVGGGTVAERKVEGLLESGARLTLVSPDLTAALREHRARGSFTHLRRRYREGDVKGFLLVVAATSSRRVNGRVFREACANRVLVNCVDDPENSTFFVPSTLRRGDLQIAISTSGKLPLLARRTRELLEARLDRDLGKDIETLAVLREKILRESREDPEAKGRKMNRVLLSKVSRLAQRISAS